MNRAVRASALLLFCVTAMGACALRLGGPGPEEYQTVALYLPAGADAAAVAARLTAADTDIVLLSAEQDSAWFAQVAAATQLELSGPGMLESRGMAFLTNMEMLGDTSLALAVPGGGLVHMHDALYEISHGRYVDLMLVHIDAPDVRAAVRTLLGYIATDVGAAASILIGLDAPTVQAADSAAVLMRATLGNARECSDEPAGETPRLRLLYGPSARTACLSAAPLPGSPPATRARIQVR